MTTALILCIANAILLVVSIIMSICILLYTVVKSFVCSSIWILTFVTMFSYLLASIANLSDLIYQIIENNSYTQPTFPGQVHIVFYLLSLLLMLIVFTNRIIFVFQNSVFAYNKCVIFVLYGLIGIVVIVSAIMFLSTFGPIEIVYLFGMIWGLSVVSLSLLLLYLFILKLIQIRKAAPDMFTYQEMFDLQLKFTVLALVSILSTFMVVAGSVIIISSPLYHSGTNIFMWYLIKILGAADTTIGFFSMSFTLKNNAIFYDKACFVCSICLKWIMMSCCTANIQKKPQINLQNINSSSNSQIDSKSKDIVKSIASP